MDKSVCFLENTLQDNDTVIVACSAGPDSMCLLSVVHHLHKRIKVICAHVNHKVRKQSDEEYLFLEKYCQERSIIFEGMELKETIKNNFESEARRIRYRFFNDLKEKYHAKYIITAHHGDDLIETILMRISRGSNVSGYAGLKLIDNDYLHPFLYIDKEEIFAYLKQNNIPYYIDQTNLELEHTRNRYRHLVLNFLKEENPKVHLKYLAFSNKLLEYDNFINQYINDHHLIKNGEIDINNLQNESDLIIKKCLELLIKDLQKNDLLDISDHNIDSMMKMIKSPTSNSQINLNNGFVAQKEYQKFRIKKEEHSEMINVQFNGLYEDDNWLIKLVDNEENDNNYVIRLSFQDIKGPLIIRSRVDGDKMEVKNLGTKKVKDIFIDAKVSKYERNTWPLICDSNNDILSIPGLKKSKFSKDKTENYDIILLCERKVKNEKC